MRQSSDVRSGFTLVELMAALSLAALVFIGVHELIDQLGMAGEHIVGEATREDERANGVRLLIALVGRAEPPTDSAERFAGDETRASFATWCEVPGGWLERCRVQLALTVDGDTTSVRAALPTGNQLSLLDVTGAAHLTYLDPKSRDESWTRSWGPSFTLPAALGIVAERDTVFLPAAGRR
jgi:prepilin-type N-terminal cleavage/methylation domain-containing protein